MRGIKQRYAVPSSHAFLDPYYHRGHVPTHQVHGPYVCIESSSRFVQSLAINYSCLVYLTFTTTQCRGFCVTWTGAGGAVGYPILARQLGTLTPSHVALQRLGIRFRNITNIISRNGLMYTLSSTDPLGVTFDADNVGDNFIRLTNAEVLAISARVVNSARTRTISATDTQHESAKGIVTLTNPDYVWQPYTPVDSTLNTANLDFENALQGADLANITSSFVIYIPATGLAQDYSFEVLSQDGARFDVDHALYGSSRHAPLVPAHHVAAMYQQAHLNSRDGEKAALSAAPHETFMQTISRYASDAATMIPNVGKAIYNTVKTGQILKTLRQAGPIIEEVGEVAPLLLM